jgi:hypothetical protein
VSTPSLALLLIVLSSPAFAQQADPAALFARGQTWDEFLAQVRAQRQTWLTNTERANPRADLVDRLKRVAGGLQLLVIAEPACTDSVHVVPYLAKLAASAGVGMRIVDKATGLTITEAHRTPDNRAATPTVVVLRQGQEAGVWVERPVVLQTWYLSMAEKVSARERLDRKLAWYEWDRGDTTLAEIVALAEKNPGVVAQGPLR